jgi:hypothetical protein
LPPRGLFRHIADWHCRACLGSFIANPITTRHTYYGISSNSTSRGDSAMSDDKPAKGVAPPLAKGDRNENPPGIGFMPLLREDLHTHNGDLLDQGFWAVVVHRFGKWRMGFRWKIVRAPLTLCYRFCTSSSNCPSSRKPGEDVSTVRRRQPSEQTCLQVYLSEIGR